MERPSTSTSTSTRTREVVVWLYVKNFSIYTYAFAQYVPALLVLILTRYILSKGDNKPTVHVYYYYTFTCR